MLQIKTPFIIPHLSLDSLLFLSRPLMISVVPIVVVVTSVGRTGTARSAQPDDAILGAFTAIAALEERSKD